MCVNQMLSIIIHDATFSGNFGCIFQVFTNQEIDEEDWHKNQNVNVSMVVNNGSTHEHGIFVDAWKFS